MVIISRCALLVTLASSNHLGVALELYVCGSKQEVDHEEAADLLPSDLIQVHQILTRCLLCCGRAKLFIYNTIRAMEDTASRYPRK